MEQTDTGTTQQGHRNGERKEIAGYSAYLKCQTATAECSDRDYIKNADAKISPGEDCGNEFGISAHKMKDISQQSS